MQVLPLLSERLALRKDAAVDWSKRWLTQAFLISTLLALLLAAHQVNIPPGANFVLAAFYWWVRLSIAFALFTGGLLLLESTRLVWLVGWKTCAVIAFFISLPVFVMFVTMLDLAAGLPELGNSLQGLSGAGLFDRLAWEVIYLTDNHAFYCLLMSVPRWWNERFAKVVLDTPRASGTDIILGQTAPEILPAFCAHVTPRPHGRLQLIEAQEHYIRVETGSGSGTALYRFGDALRDLQGQAGMQVHRSFWVADSAVAEVKKTRAGTRLTLVNGREVPVSRRFEVEVLRRYQTG